MLSTPEQGMKGSMSWTSPFGNAVLVLIFLLYVNLVVDKSFLQNRKKITFFRGGIGKWNRAGLQSVVLSFMSSLGSHFSERAFKFAFNNLLLLYSLCF